MERLMFVWDELDDWLGIGRHAFKCAWTEIRACLK
jgi:hypothetical protein